MVQQYLDHSREILTSPRSNFKGGSKKMGLISLFGYQNEYDLQKGFPLLTTKKMPFKAVAHELIWFMSGESNIKYLANNNVHIWDDNAFDHNFETRIFRGMGKKCFMEGCIENKYIQGIVWTNITANKGFFIRSVSLLNYLVP